MSTHNRTIQQFLAFDWGKLRVGVASGNTLMRSAQSVATLSQQGEARMAAIKKIIQEWCPSSLVVGVPYHPDGAPHKNTKLAKQFAAQLRELSQLTVHEVDERYSTTEAKADNPSAREAKLDGLSACIILEQYMRSLPE
jgi:putative holliday junction resolvase